MADIAASDITYTEEAGSASFEQNARRSGVFSMAFGNGTLTYPAGGLTITKGKLGCPTKIEEFLIEDPGSANGFVYKYDRGNEKLRIYSVPATPAFATGLVEFIGGTTAVAAATLKVKVTGY